MSGRKATGAQVSQETGGKRDTLMGEREIDNSLPGGCSGTERKSYSEVVIEVVRERARMFVRESIVRKPDRDLNKGDDVVVCLPCLAYN